MGTRRKGQHLVFGPEDGKSYWQPEPADGYATIKLSPENCESNAMAAGFQVIDPGGQIRPHAHARIVSIDDSAARALPGVHAVIHHGNVPRIKYASGGQSYPNPKPHDQVSFDDKVRHVGDRVAAVAAETVEIAQEACSLIEVAYDRLLYTAPSPRDRSVSRLPCSA